MVDPEDQYGVVTARYYDATYEALGVVGPDVDFYRRLANEAHGSVLELGCGTGRILLPIAADGHSCVGVDSSSSMLDALRAKTDGNGPELIVARLQDFDLGGRRFGLIFSAFRVFQHLETVEDQLACLERVKGHLAPGGSFAFDVFNPRLEGMSDPEVPERENIRFRDAGDEMIRYEAVTRDPVNQLIEVTFRYERCRNEEVVSSETTCFKMRWFTRFELEHLVARAGFDRVQMYGDFDLSPVVAGCPALIVVAGTSG